MTSLKSIIFGIKQKKLFKKYIIYNQFNKVITQKIDTMFMNFKSSITSDSQQIITQSFR